MRTSLFRSIFALCALFLLISVSVFASDKKKGPELQHPYNFTYDVVFNDSCCFDITVTAPDSGNAVHYFKVAVNDIVYVEFGDYFTYGQSRTFTICPPDTATTFTIDGIQIWCLHHGLLEEGDEGYVAYSPTTFDMTDCCNCKILPNNYPITVVSERDGENPECTGCSFKLKFTDEGGMPE